MASSAQPPMPAVQLVVDGLNDGLGPIPFAAQISVTHDSESFRVAIAVTSEPLARWAQDEQDLLATIQFLGDSRDNATDALRLAEVDAELSLQASGSATWAGGAILLMLQMNAQLALTQDVSLVPGTPPVTEQSGSVQLMVTAQSAISANPVDGAWSWTASDVSLSDGSPTSSVGLQAVDVTGAMDGLELARDMLGAGAESMARALVAVLNAPGRRAAEALDPSNTAKTGKPG